MAIDRLRQRVLITSAILGLSPAAHAGGLIIGHTNVEAVDTFPQPLMEQIAQFRFYFAHASVGGNIVDGLADLHRIKPDYYRLTPASAGAPPPPATDQGTVYEYSRGNPGWRAKVDSFATYVSNGWHRPKADVVLNKFCYIDQDADMDYYIRSMAALEAAHPDTLFVYMTIPLTTKGSDLRSMLRPRGRAENYLRNVFNDNLRGWAKANNKVLFDVADIEAHVAGGSAETFTFKERVCQALCKSYTEDGRHLDDKSGAGRQQVAKGFYALAAALLNEREHAGSAPAGETP
jgi:hypothetical protein